jgi:hypothetical protein
MAFGFAPRIEWNSKIKGRGVVGVGESESHIHEAQLVWMPPAERREYALTGPPPPQWFTDMQPAPWITPATVAEGVKLAGVSLVTVPPGPGTYVPAETHEDVPPVVPPDREVVPPKAPGKWPEPAQKVTPEPVTAPPSPGIHLVKDPAEEIIVGIAAGAAYLGYAKPDTFRRARTRHPIPGEGRASDGRPYWTPAALRSWHSRLKISGQRGDYPPSPGQSGTSRGA